jgi:hypothetical protein
MVKGFLYRASRVTKDEIVALASVLKDFHRGTVCVILQASPVKERHELYGASLARAATGAVESATQTWDALTHWQQA